MAEPHEPSYYEIALTNRQVVVAFVILLTCFLAAFFSGVWIGRESTARATQEAMVRSTPPAQQEGKSLEELDFFDSRSKKGKGDRKAARPQEAAVTPGGTLAEDLSGRKAADQPSAAPAQEEPAPAARQAQETAPTPALPDPAQERRNRRKARNAAAEEAPPAPAPAVPELAPAPAKAAKTAKATPAPAVPKGSYVIQVFSSPDQAQAERIRGKLVDGGQKAYLSPIDRGGRTMYRVRIGPFKTRADAQTVADKVRKGYKLDTWVTE